MSALAFGETGRDGNERMRMDLPIERFRSYRGYANRDTPPEDAELTHVGPGTPCGEYLRRFWHGIALSREVGDLPLAVRLFGEDLVLFRDGGGRIGLLHRHCAHRGASLEFGRIEDIPDDAERWGIKVRGAKSLAQNLAERREDAMLYKELATLRLDVPIAESLDELEWAGAERSEYRALCLECGFDRLADAPHRWA